MLRGLGPVKELGRLSTSGIIVLPNVGDEGLSVSPVIVVKRTPAYRVCLIFSQGSEWHCDSDSCGVAPSRTNQEGHATRLGADHRLDKHRKQLRMQDFWKRIGLGREFQARPQIACGGADECNIVKADTSIGDTTAKQQRHKV